MNPDDLEITKLCAEAMGIKGWLTGDDPMVTNDRGEFIEPYDPLHDDAQAMALVKKFGLDLIRHKPISQWSSYFGNGVFSQADDLNRAICECVAKMQKGKR